MYLAPLISTDAKNTKENMDILMLSLAAVTFVSFTVDTLSSLLRDCLSSFSFISATEQLTQRLIGVSLICP